MSILKRPTVGAGTVLYASLSKTRPAPEQNGDCGYM